MQGKIFILPKDSTNQQFVELSHPLTGRPLRYLLTNDHLLQILQVGDSSKQRSWFVGDHVVSDGYLYVCTPIDLLALVLPIIQELTWSRRKEPNRYVSFEDFIEHFDNMGPHYPRVSEVLSPNLLNTLHRICKVNEPVGSLPKTFQLDESSVVKILLRKAKVAQENLPPSIVTELKKQLAPLDLRTPLPQDLLELSCKWHAASLVCEDLQPEWYNKLAYWQEELAPLHAYTKNLEESRKILVEKEALLNSKKRPQNSDITSSLLKKPNRKQATKKSKYFSGEGMTKISSFFTKK
ncbi:ribonuclease H2 complex subunit Rnh202 [Schizosaccharomyces pombe]|uniref:Ribonuclease H2 subunit B n=1 Tax=Schizosaccharomyces pombe (strain 972 / ATCC 24843) TaxID=284812 RepID=RNH2B_SCHPO|nr:putative ribonuclease H2 complex subunit [Schizosaccharomyces pombe]O94627.1 RecName: Full=Ribonuclease H2 subunit B; Short=RNase H2 subunit B; Short=Rnh2B; AltName: Full=RNase H(202); AltName: Full=Ribonuclease HI subunit B [Schizosaccharomyces pombe 972h-]CAB37439.1 ribonuclease H2 complex subunit (predicted) [Schizosaccharomyces pombe]|eukprot:NP_001342878.1 putative ribonuclease H2 complex subunit [Schizosaccharomyces pombe]